MALETIEYGSVASSQTLNDNFNYLDNRISTSTSGISGTVSALSITVDSLSTTVTNLSNTSVKHTASTAVGDSSTPVYVASDGTATVCSGVMKSDMSNNTSSYPYLKTKSGGNDSGYRIWSDGFCEQWGRLQWDNTLTPSVSLSKTYSTAYYQVQISPSNLSYLQALPTVSLSNKTASSFKVNMVQDTNVFWVTYGYLASGQY